MELTGKSVLVTGASRGLGAALARELALRGAEVVMAARGEAELEATAEAIRWEGGVVWAVPADVSRPEAATPLAATAAALAGPIDILVQNASELGPVPLRLLLDTEDADLERVLQTNLVGPFRLAKAIAGAMVLRGRGLVVAITSDAGAEAYPRWGAYGLSKAALEHMTRAFAAEMEGTGVTFVNVDPGEMDTKMHADAIPDADRSALAKPADVARRIADLIGGREPIPNGARLTLPVEVLA
jgi:NAD(P)-dependent dehydrogenase (short-subunit alcohol dehydrogenase family)